MIGILSSGYPNFTTAETKNRRRKPSLAYTVGSFGYRFSSLMMRLDCSPSLVKII